MRVISRRMIAAFSTRHATAKPGLQQWYTVTKQARWQSLAEVKHTYPHADLVGDKTVFNIAGNRVRPITYINYKDHIVYIKAVLTHPEYERGNWK